MISIGPLYVQVIKYPHRKPLPIVEIGWTYEIDEPYRRGRCLVFRLPFTRPGLALGIWGQELEETEALTAALWGRHLDVPLDELLEWD
jgi:hypothetical protein